MCYKYNGNWTEWNANWSEIICVILSAHPIWNHNYDFRPKLYNTKFNYHFITAIFLLVYTVWFSGEQLLFIWLVWHTFDSNSWMDC